MFNKKIFLWLIIFIILINIVTAIITDELWVYYKANGSGNLVDAHTFSRNFTE